ncbi:hypothetical protein ACFQ0K_16330 [Nocardioides caeni]|uniref:PH domain-containing protein n=1 Tax=Nocardioides caeni TaxID=574700 RepID=A0A4S8NH67_9ACTN|nr:hypothetical protein [Nocardioides caeni]THV16107.1 hypothetical protein E9934_07185 [Nocardioides caeni]
MAVLRTVLGALLGGRADAARSDLAEAIGGEQVLLGPASASYRGSTGEHPRVKGNGTLALTPTRLLCRMVIGRPVDVDLASVTGVSTARTFAGSFVGGQTHLVVHTTTGDLAWFVPDLDQWHAAVQAAVASR